MIFCSNILSHQKKSILISVLAVESKPKILMHFRDNFVIIIHILVNRNRMKNYNIIFAFKYSNQMHILFEIDFFVRETKLLTQYENERWI